MSQGNLFPGRWAAKLNPNSGWLALDADTREIIGEHVDSQNRESARQLWRSLSSVDRPYAVFYTDA